MTHSSPDIAEARRYVQDAYDEMCVKFSGVHQDDEMDSILLRLHVALKKISVGTPAQAARPRDCPEIWILADRLAGAELNYRNTYETLGPHALETGRNWKALREAGDALRQIDDHVWESHLAVSSTPAAQPPSSAESATDAISQHLAWVNLYVGEMKATNWRDMKDRMQSQLEQLSLALRSGTRGEPQTPPDPDYFELAGELGNRAMRQQEVLDWVESWVSNPVGAYSVHALDGLFGMTRDKIAALAVSRPECTCDVSHVDGCLAHPSQEQKP